MSLDQGKNQETFIYLGEWFQPNLSEKTDLSARVNKLLTDLRTAKISKCLSCDLKLKHYTTIIQL